MPLSKLEVARLSFGYEGGLVARSRVKGMDTPAGGLRRLVWGVEEPGRLIWAKGDGKVV